MDLTSIIISLGFLAVFIVPIFCFQIVQKKEKNKFLNKFMAFAQQQQAKVTEYDIWSHHCAIGMDKNANKLFYLKEQKNTEQSVFIDLSEVEKCKTINITNTLDGSKVVTRLELVFTFYNSKRTEKTIELYNQEENMSLNDELHLLEKWAKIINSSIKANNSKVLVAEI